MNRALLTQTALQVIEELPPGTEVSGSSLRCEVAARLRLKLSQLPGTTHPWRTLLARLARLGRVRGSGRGLYRKV